LVYILALAAFAENRDHSIGPRKKTNEAVKRKTNEAVKRKKEKRRKEK
jgi:hypothetical protein